MECILKSSPKLGEPTLEVRAEDKLVCTMPYEEEEDRGCEVKCPKGGGVCGIGSTPILLPKVSLGGKPDKNIKKGKVVILKKGSS